MSHQLATLSALSPLARTLRERQEQIEAKLRNWHGLTADLVSDAAEQGRDILHAKTKLGKHLRWSDWLHAHVPNLTEAQAAKYERIAVEQLSDPRQCVFAFLPPRETEPQVKRLPPAAWESAWSHLTKLKSAVETVNTWPREQVELTKAELAPLVKALWPEGVS